MRRIITALLVTFVAMGAAGAGEELSLVDRYRVGNWALYRIMGEDDLRQRHSIVAVEGEGDDAVVTLRVVSLFRDEEKGSNDFRITMRQLREDDDNTSADVVRTEKVILKGKEYDAEVVERMFNGKKHVTASSKALPVNGTIRVQVIGTPPLSELMDFGFGEEK